MASRRLTCHKNCKTPGCSKGTNHSSGYCVPCRLSASVTSSPSNSDDYKCLKCGSKLNDKGDCPFLDTLCCG